MIIQTFHGGRIPSRSGMNTRKEIPIFTGFLPMNSWRGTSRFSRRSRPRLSILSRCLPGIVSSGWVFWAVVVCHMSRGLFMISVCDHREYSEVVP